MQRYYKNVTYTNFLYNFFVVYLFFLTFLLKRWQKKNAINRPYRPDINSSTPTQADTESRPPTATNYTIATPDEQQHTRPPHPRPLQGERWTHPRRAWYASRPKPCALGAQPGTLARLGVCEGIK